jgi:hypothetical protein
VSRGPGKLERTIRELFDANPDLAFVTDELCEHGYPGEEIERKHRVAVLRAAKNVIASDPDWQEWVAWGQGGNRVYVNCANLQSYTLGCLMCDSDFVYRSPARLDRIEKSFGSLTTPLATCDDLLRLLDKPWVHEGMPERLLKVEQHCADRDGDPARRERAWAEYVVAIRERTNHEFGVSDAEPDENSQDNTYGGKVGDLPEDQQVALLERSLNIAISVRDALAPAADQFLQRHTIDMCLRGLRELRPQQYPTPPDPSDLAALARKLITENDPDAIRAGLAEIADALDAMKGGHKLADAA